MSSQHLALVIGPDKSSQSISSIDIPSYKADEILVRIHAAALNPTDWKSLEYGLVNEGQVLGCDYAGVVEAIGSAVTKVQVGDRTPEAILIWGGSRHMAIQLAKLSGLTVITTASPANYAYLRSLGADHVLPYADPATPAAIRALTSNQLRIAFDGVSEKESATAILNSLSDDPALHKDIVILLPLQDSLGELADSMSASLRLIIVLSLLGKEDRMVWDYPISARPENYAFSVRSYELLERLLSEGKITCQKIKLMCGLERVQEGMRDMREGRVRAEKVVFQPLRTVV
ncbi:hypothetical protein HWV62_40782 [Athelia sp. TMB]|nr:hypothetical protein HWV62_40782 [Athelia sp. TMB]